MRPFLFTETIEEFRESLVDRTDQELVLYAKTCRDIVVLRPGGRAAAHLRECTAEWKRRHPQGLDAENLKKPQGDRELSGFEP